MNRVVLFFPDTKKMADFIINREVSNAEASTQHSSVTAPFGEEDVITAITDFDARLNVEWPFIAPSPASITSYKIIETKLS